MLSIELLGFKEGNKNFFFIFIFFYIIITSNTILNIIIIRRKNKIEGKKGRNNKMQDHMRTSPIKVTLKCIKNSQEMSDEYLKRVKYINYYVVIM